MELTQNFKFKLTGLQCIAVALAINEHLNQIADSGNLELQKELQAIIPNLQLVSTEVNLTERQVVLCQTSLEIHGRTTFDPTEEEAIEDLQDYINSQTRVVYDGTLIGPLK